MKEWNLDDDGLILLPFRHMDIRENGVVKAEFVEREDKDETDLQR